jgi:predicted GNAT family acetyltransferase
MNDITLSDNPDAHRFELRRNGAVQAYAEYELPDGAVKFTHTEVLPGNEGQGLGSKLATFALDDVRRRGLKVVPVCSFIAGYIARHAQYQDLVAG